MPSHKNHGNSPHVRGFRPGHIPTQVQTERPIKSDLFVVVDKERIVIQYNTPVSNVMMSIEQVDEYIANLQHSRQVLIDELSKRAAAAGKQG